MKRQDIIWEKVRKLYPNYETEKDFKKLSQILFQVCLNYQATNAHLENELNWFRNEAV